MDIGLTNLCPIFSKAPTFRYCSLCEIYIHNTDAQLEKDRPELAETYNGRSIAEQHSIATAWGIFMEPRFVDLRNTICNHSKTELNRLYQLIVNIIMATDIADKQLREFRSARFTKAFGSDGTTSESSLMSPREACNLKATVGMEYLIQVSDVAHTMQPWPIYRQWNAKLFAEMYKAYKDGRSEKDPSEFWYEGEIGFFDYYMYVQSSRFASPSSHASG